MSINTNTRTGQDRRRTWQNRGRCNTCGLKVAGERRVRSCPCGNGSVIYR
jgi:hypothetical protein